MKICSHFQSFLWFPKGTYPVCSSPYASLSPVFNAQRLAIPGLPVNCQPIAPGLHNSLRPYIHPTIPPDFVAKDRFHPVIRGEQKLGISWGLQQRTEAVRNQISRGIEQRENNFKPGDDVGIVTLGTGGSLPSKYRNGSLLFISTIRVVYISFLSVVDAHSDTILG
jgi:hypothetical protein